MKKAFRILFVALLIALMLVSVVACGGSSENNGTENGGTSNSTSTSDANGNSTAKATAAPSNGDSSTVGGNFTKSGEVYSFYSWQYSSDNPYSGDDERSQQMRERVERIESDYGISIQFVTGSQTTAMLQSAYQGSPEITGMKEGGLHTMMDTYLYNNLTGKCLTPLSDHSDVYNFKDENKFNVESQYDLCEYNSKLWFFIPVEIGVHFECGGNCLVFNKKLLEAAGYPADTIYGWVKDGTWTWDKFEQCLQATTDATKGQWGIERGNEALVMWSLANSNDTEFVRLEVQANGQKQDKFVYSGEQGEKLMEAYDEFIKLAKNNWMETTWYGATDTKPLEHFKNGSVAFFYNGYSSNPLKDISTMDEDYGLVPWPKGPSNVKGVNEYKSFYPHLNPYCVFRDTDGNVKGAVQILCELYTPIYDANSEDAQALYETEKKQFTRDADSQANLDIVENAKVHFRVFMYSKAPCSVGTSTTLSGALFGKGEDAILAQTQNASTYFKGISQALNVGISQRSPYSWK